ncbi:MAG: transposase [Chthoniobacteraceae bacterium]
MKGKRYTTEEKIRILRQADAGKRILDVCREYNISKVSFHRRKRQFGQMEVNEARRLKDLERENTELKKMLSEALLKNRVLEAVCEKMLCARNIAGCWRSKRSRKGCVRGERRVAF